MPHPDQGLADGHFEGETGAHGLHQGEKVGHALPTCAHQPADSQINVLPAGSDLEHPPIEDELAARPDPIQLKHAEPETSNALNVAPASTPVPIDTTKWEKVEKDLEADVKSGAKKAEKKGKELGDKAEKKGKELSAEAQKAGREINDKAQKAGKEVSDAAKDLKKKAKVSSLLQNCGAKLMFRPNSTRSRTSSSHTGRRRRTLFSAPEPLVALWVLSTSASSALSATLLTPAATSHGTAVSSVVPLPVLLLSSVPRGELERACCRAVHS